MKILTNFSKFEESLEKLITMIRGTAKLEQMNWSAKRSQPDNLVMLLNHYHYSFLLKLIPYMVYKHRKICICMTKCQAGFATGIGQTFLEHFYCQFTLNKPSTPSSKPFMTSPLPSLNWNGLPIKHESNSFFVFFKHPL